jgi:hypothetical protein
MLLQKCRSHFQIEGWGARRPVWRAKVICTGFAILESHGARTEKFLSAMSLFNS